MSWPMPIVLASRSPRRLHMLQATGWPIQLDPPDVDDGRLQRGSVDPDVWVEALALMKAKALARLKQSRGDSLEPCTILGADTVCLHGSEVMGQPSDVEQARAMLERHQGTSHEVLTGTCLIAWPEMRRLLFIDRATVTWDIVGEAAMQQYLDEEAWRGKAGAYNLQDRIDAGWPIKCEGDPSTVMGLPMRRLRELFGHVESDTVSP